VSRASKSPSGPEWFLYGLGVCVICGALLAVTAITGAEPLTGRWAAFVVLGAPVGLVLMLIGVIKTLRNRR
jgi:5,10-methenyltetrahydromethanopterin hydrogenase